MSQDVEEDLRAFVVARWPELEAVARVVVLDPGLARRVTTDALAGLAGRWRESVEDGRPGEDARRALLAAALTALGQRSPGTRVRSLLRQALPPAAHDDPSSHPAPQPAAVAGHERPLVAAADPWEDEEPDPLVAAVLATLVASDPVDRALVGARVVWELRPHEVAHLLGRPHGELAGRERALDRRLDAARGAARRAAGLEDEAGWQGRAQDVEAAVDVLLRGQDDPPDPGALVTERSGDVRRRQVVLGGVAAVAVAGLGAAAVATRDGPRTPVAPTPGPARPTTTPAPGDPSWARIDTWAARGPLARDPGTEVLLASAGLVDGQVLWAGDVGARRLVVARQRIEGDIDGSAGVVVFGGAAGQAVRSLQQENLSLIDSGAFDEAVAVAVPNGGADDDLRATALVVLTRPTTRGAAVSPVVVPEPDGTATRELTDLPLDGGVARAVLDGRPGAALRVRVGGVETTPAMVVERLDEIHDGPTDGAGLADGARRYVALLTGIAEEDLRTRVVVEERIEGRVVSDTTYGVSRVAVVHTTTPGGAVLCSALLVHETDYGTSTTLLRSATILPRGRVGDPIVERVNDERPGVGRFLVIAPGAERIQLIAASPDGYPVSKVVRSNGRDAVVVAMVNADTASSIRVVARDAARRVLFDDVPVDPRPLVQT